MIKFTITSTKGGVGKTTLTANLGALLADMGLRVLLIDADVQPSLSKYFPLVKRTPAAGLTEVIVRGQVTATCITPTVYPNLAARWIARMRSASPLSRLTSTAATLASLSR